MTMASMNPPSTGESGEFHVHREQWSPWSRRFAAGEWRAELFADLLIREFSGLGAAPLTAVDVGCGHGFDGDAALQRKLGQDIGTFIGIEPDSAITIDPCFHVIHRSVLEEAPIEPDSVDLCYSTMVLEHVADPEEHWKKIHSILRPGGVYWGFTVDGAHWFTKFSQLSEVLAVKNSWLNIVSGRPGKDRYENYPTHYRSNTPEQLRRLTGRFSCVDLVFFRQPGQAARYFPPRIKWVAAFLDTLCHRDHRRGMNLAIRAQK
jgi:SAM-dependent methyltransferase